ncbi:MAG: hypothetical protein RR603_02585, partial [Kurthia sp.]
DVSTNKELRQAVVYSIDQDAIIDFYKGNKKKAISPLSPLVDTGLELKADSAKVKELLSK